MGTIRNGAWAAFGQRSLELNVLLCFEYPGLSEGSRASDPSVKSTHFFQVVLMEPRWAQDREF